MDHLHGRRLVGAPIEDPPSCWEDTHLLYYYFLQRNGQARSLHTFYFYYFFSSLFKSEGECWRCKACEFFVMPYKGGQAGVFSHTPYSKNELEICSCETYKASMRKSYYLYGNEYESAGQRSKCIFLIRFKRSFCSRFFC